jgi:hypothetical protein
MLKFVFTTKPKPFVSLVVGMEKFQKREEKKQQIINSAGLFAHYSQYDGEIK